ncbi:hypothetical protein F4809DRAFT_239402 [Biscogniauxia mediterranea]|nr:hypothetical protein F4809DRAFT_239402 [Biscogniauxia mediterranea]
MTGDHHGLGNSQPATTLGGGGGGGPSPWKRFFALACLISVAMSAFTIFQSHAQYHDHHHRAAAAAAADDGRSLLLSWRLVADALVVAPPPTASQQHDDGLLRRGSGSESERRRGDDDDWPAGAMMDMDREVEESGWVPEHPGAAAAADQEQEQEQEQQPVLPRLNVFLTTHFLFSFTTAFYALPLAMGFESARNILIRLRRPHVLPDVPAWTNFLWLGIVGPSLVVVPVSGFLAADAYDFHMTRVILGSVTLLAGAVAVTLHYLMKVRPAGGLPPSRKLATARHIVNLVFLLLSVAGSMMSFVEPSKTLAFLTETFPVEYVIVGGFGLASTIIIAPAICVLDLYLALRECNSRESAGDATLKEIL